MSSSQRPGMLYTGCDIPLSAVITFPQVRKTFEQDLLQELADDIAENGVLQPSIVGKLSYESFVRYKETFEIITKQTFPSIESYPTHEGYYYCLIAGERRFRAHQLLWDTGCSECIEAVAKEHRVLFPGECYHAHFADDTVEIRSCLNVDPFIAKSIQFRENNYVKPPVHEEAYSYEEFYRYQKTFNPKITFVQFAKTVGVSVARVKNALWFCELPERAQAMVKNKMITYSNALELKKILGAGFEEKESNRIIERELDYLMLHPRIKYDDYKKRVRDIVVTVQQGTLFDTNDYYVGKKGKRKIVQEHLIPFLSVIHSYMKKLAALNDQKMIGKGKLYSGTSPNNQMKTITKDLEIIFPGLLTPRQVKQISAMDFEKGTETVMSVVPKVG